MKEKAIFQLVTESVQEQTTSRIRIEGFSDMSETRSNLRVRAAIDLLTGMKREEFVKIGKEAEFDKLYEELQELVRSMLRGTVTYQLTEDGQVIEKE